MSGKSTDPTGLLIGGEPRIDFLPLEIKQRKANRRSRRSLVFLVLVVIVICVGGYVASAGLAAQSQAELDAARAQTQVLLQQQGEYSVAETTATEIEAAKGAQLVGTATEVLWKEYIAEIKGELPTGTKMVSFTVDSLNVLELEPTVVTPLEQRRVGTVNFIVSAKSLAQIDSLSENLKDVTGYADATVVAVAGSDIVSGTYVANVTFHFNPDAYARRLFPPSSDTAETDPAATTPTTEG